MAQLRTRRSQEEWLELIQECRCSGMTDRDWCDQHGIVVSSFYNAVKRLRKKACDIPYISNKKSYALDLTSNKQDVVQIDIYPDHDPEAGAVALPQTPAVHLDNSHTVEPGVRHQCGQLKRKQEMPIDSNGFFKLNLGRLD